MPAPDEQTGDDGRKHIRTKKGIKEYSYLGCPLTRNSSAWCFRMCKPDAEGHGHCGRLAPHALKSRIQSAIERHSAEQHFRELEQDYLDNPEHPLRDPGIRISEGEADIVLQLQEDDLHPAGGAFDALCFRLMNDAAAHAVGSLLEAGPACTAEFSVVLSHSAASSDLIARGRYVGRAGSTYLAEAMLTDTGGRELARGEGVFLESPGEDDG